MRMLGKDGAACSGSGLTGRLGRRLHATPLAVQARLKRACRCRVCRNLPALRMQDEEGKVVGATVRDGLSGTEQDVYARSVINAAGPFSDEVRHLSQVGLPACALLPAGLLPAVGKGTAPCPGGTL